MKKIIACVCILLAGLLFVPWMNVFSFEEMRTNEPTKHFLKIGQESQFQIVFTHSIHLTDVVESYEVQPDDNIKLVSMQYSDVAIGMPGYAEEGQTLIYEDGLYTLKYDDKQLEEFSLYIGDVDYELNFNYEANSYNLKKQLRKGNSYLFSIERVSVYEFMKGERIRDEQ